MRILLLALVLPLLATAQADPWTEVVKPRLDCWSMAGGPGYQWVWSDVAPWPERPLPTGRLPPCV